MAASSGIWVASQAGRASPNPQQAKHITHDFTTSAFNADIIVVHQFKLALVKGA